LEFVSEYKEKSGVAGAEDDVLPIKYSDDKSGRAIVWDKKFGSEPE
jgi:hypothetical protein